MWGAICVPFTLILTIVWILKLSLKLASDERDQFQKKYSTTDNYSASIRTNTSTPREPFFRIVGTYSLKFLTQALNTIFIGRNSFYFSVQSSARSHSFYLRYSSTLLTYLLVATSALHISFGGCLLAIFFDTIIFSIVRCVVYRHQNHQPNSAVFL